MATVSINPIQGPHSIVVQITLQFSPSEIEKEYVLRGEVDVIEGRDSHISTLSLNEIVTPASIAPVQLQQSFPIPEHRFQLTFKPSYKLYVEI